MAEGNAPDFSEFKSLSRKDLKQKLVDLGLDTKGTKAELLVRVEKHLASVGKRSNNKIASANSKNKKVSKTSASGGSSECAICLEVIVDRSGSSNGEDSVFCEGDCQRWLHRTCVGLTDRAFEAIRDSDEKFLCYQCFVNSHVCQMKELRDSIAMLTREVTSLKSQLSEFGSQYNNVLPTVHNDDETQDDIPPTNTTVQQSRLLPMTKPTARSDCKFNNVVYLVFRRVPKAPLE